MNTLTLLRAAGRMPAPASGWLLRLAGGARRLLAPDGGHVCRVLWIFLMLWPEMVRRGGGYIVLIGAVGLGRYGDHDLAVADLRRLLNRAARAGEVVGGLVQTEC